MADPLRHRQTKGAATDMVDLTPPRHIPTLPNLAVRLCLPVLWRDPEMVLRRTAAAGFKVKLGCHVFRATGITAYLEAGGTLENAQAMAAHESSRTTKLYDRTGDEITLDEVERIAI